MTAYEVVMDHYHHKRIDTLPKNNPVYLGDTDIWGHQFRQNPHLAPAGIPLGTNVYYLERIDEPFIVLRGYNYGGKTECAFSSRFRDAIKGVRIRVVKSNVVLNVVK